MNDYKIIYILLLNIYSGKNLNEQFGIYQDKIENYSKIKNIVFGILRNHYWIDEVIKTLVKPNNPISNLIILRIAIYEIYFSNKKSYAITNDLVNLAKINKLPFGFINAILRKIILEKQSIQDKVNLNNTQVKYNLPKWLINKLDKYNPDELLIFREEPYITIRLNHNKISLDEYIKLLLNNNINYIIHNDYLVITSRVKIIDIPLFIDGYVFIQDIGAQEFIKFFDKFINNKKTVLDVCAAPGGKLTQILEQNKYQVTAVDINQDRLSKIHENLDRLQLSCNLLLGDATTIEFNNKFDCIIADVPCSATGTIKRNPDIIISRRLEDVQNFVTTQRNIIDNIWQYLADDGLLIYATCSVLEEENIQNIQYFTQKYDDFRLIEDLNIKITSYNDGFYYAAIRKNNEK